VTPRAALLSNFEVLTLLRELEADQLARTKTALRIKKEEDEKAAVASLSKGKGKEKEISSSSVMQLPIEEVSENLRTVAFEVRSLCILTAALKKVNTTGNSISHRRLPANSKAI